MKEIKVGIIGCGKISRDIHIPIYLRMKNVKIQAICDTNSKNIEKIQQTFNLNAKPYGDYRDLIENEDIDFIDICTPGFSHYQIAKEALKKSLNVITEKPPALSLKDFFELKNLSKKYSLTFGVILNYRYKDMILKLKENLDSGKLGEIRKIQTIHHGPMVFNDNSWLWNEKQSYYLLYEYGIHFFDLQCFLCGPHEKVTVESHYHPSLDSTTDIQVRIQFMNGCIGLMDLSADSTKHSSFYSMMNVYGSGSDAFVKFFPPSLSLISGFHNPLNSLSEELSSFIHLSKKVIKNEFSISRQHSHQNVLSLFVNSIVNNEPFPLSLENVEDTMKLLEEIKANVPSYLLE
jgi:predicted dehydrogenase